MRKINVDKLKTGISGITLATSTFYHEAVLIALIQNKHESGVILKLEGTFKESIQLTWKSQVSVLMLRAWQNQIDVANFAAVGLSLLLVCELTEFKSFETGIIGTGIDYWMSSQKYISDLDIFDKEARIEISGILKETKSNTVNMRLNLKKKQIKKSDSSNTPAWIAIVEFSSPKSTNRETMNATKNVHRKAMEYAIFAEMGKAKQLPEKEIKEAYFKAYILEKKAVEKAIDSPDKIGRFILMRSEAALAYKADLLEESKILVAKCKAENPPDWIVQELDDILDLVVKEEKKSTKAPLQIEGIITNADLHDSQIIIAATAEDKFQILIPSNRLTEIIKTYWSQKVQILVRKTVTGLMILEDIKRAA